MIAYQVDWRETNVEHTFYISAMTSSEALAKAVYEIQGLNAYAFLVKVTPLGNYRGQA